MSNFYDTKEYKELEKKLETKHRLELAKLIYLARVQTSQGMMKEMAKKGIVK